MFKKKQEETEPTPLVIESVRISRKDEPDEWYFNIKTWKRNTHDYQFNFYDGRVLIIPSYGITCIMMGRIVNAPLTEGKES